MQLLESGVSPTQIESGLRRLESLLPHVERPLAQLELLVHDHHLLMRDEIGLLEPASGQRFFEFDSASATEISDSSAETVPFPTADETKGAIDNPELLFQEACRALDANQLSLAEWGFRQALQHEPNKAEYHSIWQRHYTDSKNIAGAIERYHNTIEQDPYYLEAWTQLGCLYAELNRHEEATRHFQTALSLHPEYPDAIYHLADVHQQLGRGSCEAASHWETYLNLDSRGPEAENARQSLQKWESNSSD
ncbi:MAG: tetratricopeptide repeat protein [Planctomycetaceae bacterium]